MVCTDVSKLPFRRTTAAAPLPGENLQNLDGVVAVDEDAGGVLSEDDEGDVTVSREVYMLPMSSLPLAVSSCQTIYDGL